MNISIRSGFALVGAGILAVSLAGCGADPRQDEPESSAPETSAPASVDGSAEVGDEPETAATEEADPEGSESDPEFPTVAGYDVGEFPPVPLFRLPDLSLLDEASADGFTLDIRDDFAEIPGVTVAPAHCGDGGTVTAGAGSAHLYGDGSGVYTGPDGGSVNYGDGSGTFTLNGVTVVNYGDGSGVYDDGTVNIVNYGDGSGLYTDDRISVRIFGDGSGNYTAGDVSIVNYGDGSGTFTAGDVSIVNYGDGSGNYTDDDIAIVNYGDGTGLINGESVELEPIGTVPELGVFPTLDALQPIESCGTVITFDDGVLFDFDKSDVRPDAAETLETVAEALTSYDVAEAVISGHTDAIGGDAYNQTLSEERADAVVAALEAAGVTSNLTAEGFGETRPVAPNEIDGEDNPAGRQLNRRVEIFIPAF
ncbi:MAG TPA: OmpA family protein [Microbacterium sp.]|nr:OmpA family protein [Microbacterium sp.]